MAFTDNAQVRQQIVPVNSRVQGYIKEIRFNEYEPVRKGDTLVVIDDSDMRQRIAQAEAGVELAKALLETAELNLSYCVILAPCDGYTSRKEIQVGQLVQPGQTLLDAAATDVNPAAAHIPVGELYGLVQTQALVVSMKEIYGWLLIAGIVALTIILLSYSSVRPWAIFPKWSTVRKVLRRSVMQLRPNP